jgi:hypothetical protein
MRFFRKKDKDSEKDKVKTVNSEPFKCGICSKDIPPVETMMNWCVHCQKIVCNSCWVTKTDGKYCPNCGQKLTSLDKTKPLKKEEQKQKEKSEKVRGRPLDIERSCIPCMRFRDDDSDLAERLKKKVEEKDE